MMMVFFVPRKNLRVQDLSKYKKFDTSNHIKLVEDAVFEYLGFDDSCNLDPLSFKRESWDDQWHITIAISTTNVRSDVFMNGLKIDLSSLYDRTSATSARLVV